MNIEVGKRSDFELVEFENEARLKVSFFLKMGQLIRSRWAI